jgi:hypothetical protein
MPNKTLAEKYNNKIHGVLNCYDRIVITGTLPGLCYAQGMTSYLYSQHIRIFDYPQFASPLRDQIRKNAEAIADKNNITIEFIRKQSFRKEKRVKQIIKERGDHPGLVHIFSTMETCQTYKPWYDKKQGKAFLKGATSKCAHYYFYFIDEVLGLCYVRVPTWCPFRLQIYFNGHNLLASQLRELDIDFELVENAFLKIDDFDVANQLGDQITVEQLHLKFNSFAEQYCPVITDLNVAYHWSIMQAEYATDIVFKRQKDLQAIYPRLVETLIHSVKPENIATFLGRKLHGNYQDEMGNNFNVRIMGSRIKHHMGPVSIKMYDKFGIILRIEITVNDVSFFKQFREVAHRDGTRETRYTNMRKSIYSLNPLQEVLLASNTRYLNFISEIETPEIGIQKLAKLTQMREQNNHRYKGFNLLSEEDTNLFRILIRGEFMINGFTNKNIRHLLNKNSGQVSRLIKRLRIHGLIKKIENRYKYYLTKLGCKVIAMTIKLRELHVIPVLAYNK